MSNLHYDNCERAINKGNCECNKSFLQDCIMNLGKLLLYIIIGGFFILLGLALLYLGDALDPFIENKSCIDRTRTTPTYNNNY